MSQDKLVLIRQALAAAESSIKTAKQLLSEVESGGLHMSAKDLPGEVGVFDGVSMVGENGEKMDVPANYASKSMLVVGDTLKQLEENGAMRFKQIEHVKRHKTTGILHKKDGKFKVITPEGSYNVLESAVEHFKGQVGDEVVLHLPAGNLTASYGAIERILKPGENAEVSNLAEEVTSESVVKAPVALSAPNEQKKEPAPAEAPKTKGNGPATSPRKKKNRKPSNSNKRAAEKLVEKSSPVNPTPPPVVVTPEPQPVNVPMPAPGEDDELR